MYRIDFNKWMQAVEAADKGPFWKRQDTLTLLYSIRAHGRGRVHRKLAGLTYSEACRLGAVDSKYSVEEHQKFTDAHGTITLELTLEHQAKLIGDKWKEFEKVETELVAELSIVSASR